MFSWALHGEVQTPYMSRFIGYIEGKKEHRINFLLSPKHTVFRLFKAFVCSPRRCGSLGRWEHSYHTQAWNKIERGGLRPFPSWLKWFVCSEKPIQLWIDSTAESEPNKPCVLGCSICFVDEPKDRAVALYRMWYTKFFKVVICINF